VISYIENVQSFYEDFTLIIFFFNLLIHIFNELRVCNFRGVS